MAARDTASGPGRLFNAATAAFLLVAPFPHSAGWRISLLLVAAAALAWDARNDPRRMGLGLVPRPFAFAAIAWCAWCVASLAWSVDARYTGEELRREIAYDVLAFVVFFAGTRQAAQLHRAVVVLLASALLLGLAEWLYLAFPAVWLLGRGSVGPGPLSTQVVLVAPLAILIVWPAPAGLGRGRAVAISLAAALVVAGLAGESRILWVALLAAMAAAFAVFSADMPKDDPSRRSVRWALAIAVAALALLMVASAEYKTRYYTADSTVVDALAYDQRPLIWRAASQKIAERPLLGHGYGREIVAPAIRAATPDAGFPLNHAHNVFADVTLQLGVVGAALFLWLLGSLGWAFARLRERAGGVALAITGLATMAGYLTKNLTDDFYFRPHAMMFWAIAGMLLGAGLRAPKLR